MSFVRYASKTPFPAYAFVPGMHPHPVTDSRGHSFGRAHAISEPLNPDHPESSHEYLEAIDLFNAGYYWEAHEIWEGLWIAAKRKGLLADFVKGLIKLAAAGVKSRQGQAAGVQRHSLRAAELFESIRDAAPLKNRTFCGLRLDELILKAHSLADDPIVNQSPSVSGLVVIPFRLSLTDVEHI